MNVYECNGANNVHELKDGMFYSTRRSRVEWNIPAFNEWTCSHHCTNEKHSLFVLYNIQVDLCHFDWKIQLSKQTKRRPTIFNCRSRMLEILLIFMPCSNTCCVTKGTRTQWCFYSACCSIRKVPLHAASVQWYFSDGTKKHGEWLSVQWYIYLLSRDGQSSNQMARICLGVI